MPRWGERGEFVSSGRRGGCALVGGRSAPVGRGAVWRGEWVHLSSGPPSADVRGPWGSRGVSHTPQLYQRDGGVGAAHAGGAAPTAGAGRGGNAGSGGRAGGGGRAAALPRAAMLEKDVSAQLASSLAGVEQRRAALRVPGGHIRAILEGGSGSVTARPPRGHPHAAPRDFQAHSRSPFGIHQPPHAWLFLRCSPQRLCTHPPPLTYPQQQLRDDNVGELRRQVKWGAKLRVLYAGVERPVSCMGQKQENGSHVLGLHRGPQLAAQRLLRTAQRCQEQQLLVLGANP